MLTKSPHQIHLLYDIVNFSWSDAIKCENRILYSDTRGMVSHMWVYTRYIMHRFINRQDVASDPRWACKESSFPRRTFVTRWEMLDDQRFEKFSVLCTIYHKKILYIKKQEQFILYSIFNQTSETTYYNHRYERFHPQNFQHYTSDKIHLSKRKKRTKGAPSEVKFYSSCTHVGSISIYRWILIEYVRKKMMDFLSNVNHRSGSVTQDDWPFWEAVWIGRSTYFRSCCDLPSCVRADSQLSTTIRACSFSRFRKRSHTRYSFFSRDSDRHD